MKTHIEMSFTSHSMFPARKNEPSEHDMLARYFAALTAVNEYAREKGFILEDEELSNINEEMCIRKIGNFAYGYDHQVKAEVAGAESPACFRARIVAYNYADYSKYGDMTLNVEGEQDLVERVNSALEHARGLTQPETQELKAKFGRGKRGCYGYCKR